MVESIELTQKKGLVASNKDPSLFGGCMRRVIALAMIMMMAVGMGYEHMDPLLVLFEDFNPTLDVAAAEARVICDVETITDNSARVTLKWSDASQNETIAIKWFEFRSSDELIVHYDTGSDLPDDFDSRTAISEKYSFPMRVVLESAAGHTPEFTDLSSSDPGYASVINLYHRGIIGGYPDGTFKPENNVTRAEFSKMLLLTAGYEVNETMSSTFVDVDNDFWGRKYIMTLASREIINGKGQGIFDSNGDVTIGEVLKMLSKTFELYGEGGTYPYTMEEHWSNEYFLDVVSDGLVKGSDPYYRPYTPNTKATREDCAILLSRVLEELHDVTQ